MCENSPKANKVGREFTKWNTRVHWKQKKSGVKIHRGEKKWVRVHERKNKEWSESLYWEKKKAREFTKGKWGESSPKKKKREKMGWDFTKEKEWGESSPKEKNDVRVHRRNEMGWDFTKRIKQNGVRVHLRQKEKERKEKGTWDERNGTNKRKRKKWEQ